MSEEEERSEAQEIFWRTVFADELDDQVVTSTDAPSTKWFNEGVKYAAMFLRHSREPRYGDYHWGDESRPE